MPVDYNRYHPKWHLISKLIRFRRAHGKCEHCGAKHFQMHPITGSHVILATAHLDHNIDNNDFENLAALCQRCHLNHDRNQHIRSRKYGKYYNRREQMRINFNHQLILRF